MYDEVDRTQVEGGGSLASQGDVRLSISDMEPVRFK
jgi:hypothetical protein